MWLRLTISSIPKIREQVVQKAASIDHKLSQLPEPNITNPELTVYTELIKLGLDLKNHINGGSAEYPFQKAWNDLSRRFQRALVDSSPKLMVTSTTRRIDPGTSTENALATPSSARANSVRIEISDDDDNGIEKTTPIKGSKKRPCNSTQSTPSKVPRRMSVIPRYESADPVRKQPKKFTLPEIRELIRDAYVGIHGQTDSKTIEHMIGLSIAHWDGHLDTFLKEAKSLIRDTVVERLEETFERYRQTELFKQVLQICEYFLNDAIAQHTQTLRKVLRWEQRRPTALNDKAAILACDRAREILQKSRLNARARVILNEQERISGRSRNDEAKAKELEKIMEKEGSKPDEYSQEIEAMVVSHIYTENAEAAITKRQ